MVLLISSVFPPEPVVSAVVGSDLAVALSENFQVTVITPRPTRPMGFSFKEEPYENTKFEHLILDSYTCPESHVLGRGIESYSFGKHAAKYIKKNRSRIKCIFIHAWPLFAQYLIVKAAKRYKIQYVIHVVDIYPEALLGRLPAIRSVVYRLLLPIDEYVLRNAFKVITISFRMKKRLVDTRGLEENKVAVIHNWQDEEKFIAHTRTQMAELRSPVFTFMFLGNLSKTASIVGLISAFRACSIENARLVIAGNGSEREKLVSLTGDLNGKIIEFWNAPLMEVPAIQDKADVLLLSLKKDAAKLAMPSKIPAYMLSGKPIIACVDGDSDTANAIKQSNCGWVVKPENIEELSQSMKAVASIPHEELFNYGQNGFNYAMENFSKKKNLRMMVSIIEEMANKNPLK